MWSVRQVIGVGLGVGTLAWLTYCFWRRRNYRKPPAPDKWQRIGTLKEIDFYPVKSGSAIVLDNVECTNNGLSASGLWDRCLVAMNEKGNIVYAGTYPSMLSVKSTILSEGVLRVDAPNLPSLTLDFKQLLQNATIKKIEQKGFWQQLVELGAEHHEWFSRAILNRDSGLRVHISLPPIVKHSWWRNNTREYFAIMVLHEKSVQDLNMRLPELPKPVKCEQFRGNLLIESEPFVPPYDEDKWIWLKIGNDDEHSIVMRFNSNCLRCILVNLDVNDYTRNASFEPLKTLKKYRILLKEREPAMGVYFDMHKCGLIRRGDPVYVQYK